MGTAHQVFARRIEHYFSRERRFRRGPLGFLARWADAWGEAMAVPHNRLMAAAYAFPIAVGSLFFGSAASIFFTTLPTGADRLSDLGTHVEASIAPDLTRQPLTETVLAPIAPTPPPAAASEPPAETVLTPLSPLPLAKPDLSTNPLLPSIAAAHNARHAAAIANLMTGSGTTAAEHRILVVQPGDSLMGLLGRLGLAPEEARTLMAALPDRFDARRLRPGHQIRVLIERPLTDGWSPTGLTTPAIVRRLTIDPAPAEPIRLERTVEDGFIILSEAEGASPAWPSGTRTVRAYGPIRSSLYETTAQLGLPKAVINDFVKLFSSDVDFQREIHRGDQFDLLYTPDKGSDGGVIDYGALTLRARTVEFYRYTTADGKTGYFDAQGRSAGKSFLRTPIDGARISSGFGPRMHPILGFTKMHQGVDFAAPAGTPVYAAGAGKLTHVGRRGSFGHYVGIQHADGYTTAYAHLAGYPKGLRVGQTVTQGQVIGFVGSTGRSTGPHLHYEVHKNKRPIDPMRHKGSTRLVLNDSERATFERYKDRLHQVRRTAFTVSSKQTAIAR